jgi:hypothetical protein
MGKISFPVHVDIQKILGINFGLKGRVSEFPFYWGRMILTPPPPPPPPIPRCTWSVHAFSFADGLSLYGISFKSSIYFRAVYEFIPYE